MAKQTKDQKPCFPTPKMGAVIGNIWIPRNVSDPVKLLAQTGEYVKGKISRLQYIRVVEFTELGIVEISWQPDPEKPITKIWHEPSNHVHVINKLDSGPPSDKVFNQQWDMITTSDVIVLLPCGSMPAESLGNISNIKHTLDATNPPKLVATP